MRYHELSVEYSRLFDAILLFQATATQLAVTKMVNSMFQQATTKEDRKATSCISLLPFPEVLYNLFIILEQFIHQAFTLNYLL